VRGLVTALLQGVLRKETLEFTYNKAVTSPRTPKMCLSLFAGSFLTSLLRGYFGASLSRFR